MGREEFVARLLLIYLGSSTSEPSQGFVESVKAKVKRIADWVYGAAETPVEVQH